MRRSAAGDQVYDTPIDVKCQIIGQVKMLTYARAQDKVSYETVYIDGEDVTEITTDDVFIFNGKQRPIQGVKPNYDGNTGKIDLWEVYL